MWIWHVSTTTIMNYLPSNLEFKDGVAFIGETSLLDVAKEYGTPLYVYDWEHLRDNIDYFTNAFGEETYFRYAAKAFICKALVKELDDKGWGVDVVSGGEMATVQAVTGTLEKLYLMEPLSIKTRLSFLCNITEDISLSIIVLRFQC